MYSSRNIINLTEKVYLRGAMKMNENEKTYGNITIKVRKKKEDTTLSKVRDLLSNESGTYTIEAKVNKIIQTRGPTIFKAMDETANADIAGFVSPGERAFPEIKENDSICAKVTIRIKDDKKRINITELSKIQDISLELDRMLDTAKDSETTALNFTIESPVLDALKDKFRSASALIKKSISEGRQILIRHHADMDGYAGAIALEKAILPMIEKRFGDRDKWFCFDRSPSTTPFYEYKDVLKDLAFAKKNIERFGKLEPLVILVDNGSTEEDLLSIRKAKIYNIPIIVVDHHFTKVEDGKSVVDPYIDVHINPYLKGGDKNLTAGMLAYELSRIINPAVDDMKILPALAGIGDKSKGHEFEEYLKNSKKDESHLKKIATCVDYEASYLRFMQDSGLVCDLIVEDEKNAALVNLLYEDIQEKINAQTKVLLKYVKEETLKNGIIAALIDIAKSTQRGDFPGPGKSAGILNDKLNQKHGKKKLVTIGYGPDFITMRSNDACEKIGFNVNVFVKRLEEDIPHAMVSGGGHEVAGSIKFVESAKDEVLKNLIKYIEELKSKD